MSETKFYTYILISESSKRTYTGSTSNLHKRLKDHNAGKVKSSRAFRPFRLVRCEEFNNKKEAKDREIFYKSRTGRRRLKKLIERGFEDTI